MPGGRKKQLELKHTKRLTLTLPIIIPAGVERTLAASKNVKTETWVVEPTTTKAVLLDRLRNYRVECKQSFQRNTLIDLLIDYSNDRSRWDSQFLPAIPGGKARGKFSGTRGHSAVALAIDKAYPMDEGLSMRLKSTTNALADERTAQDMETMRLLADDYCDLHFERERACASGERLPEDWEWRTKGAGFLPPAETAVPVTPVSSMSYGTAGALSAEAAALLIQDLVQARAQLAVLQARCAQPPPDAVQPPINEPLPAHALSNAAGLPAPAVSRALTSGTPGAAVDHPPSPPSEPVASEAFPCVAEVKVDVGGGRTVVICAAERSLEHLVLSFASEAGYRTLFKEWYEADADSPLLRIDGYGIPVHAWPQVYQEKTKLARKGTWDAMKSSWHAWKYLVEEYERQGHSVENFLRRFTRDDGHLEPFTDIQKVLERERADVVKQDVADARRFFSGDLYGTTAGTTFKYRDDGRWSCVLKADAIAKRWRSLLLRDATAREKWEVMRPGAPP